MSEPFFEFQSGPDQEGASSSSESPFIVEFVFSLQHPDVHYPYIKPSYACEVALECFGWWVKRAL